MLDIEGYDELSFLQLKSNQTKPNKREMQLNCNRHTEKSMNYPHLKRSKFHESHGILAAGEQDLGGSRWERLLKAEVTT